MISHFRFRAPAVRVRPLPGPAPTLPADMPAPAEPLADLLRTLRGRQVVLQVGERLVAGKLITTDPVTLVGPAGEVTIVAPGMVKSVQF